jgi:hypothetical protein
LPAACVLLLASPAQADVSSWVSAAAGATILEQKSERFTVPTLELKAGLGTPPGDWLALGGVFQLQTHFGKGTDLGLLARVATRGFVVGKFGLALDVGGYERFWGDKSAGGLGALVLGAPWGIVLSAGGGMGTGDQRHYGVVLGFDFARLTVYRESGTSYYPNPFPAFRK